MKSLPTLRIALWQCEQHPGDVAGNLARLRETALRVAADGVQLLVCPEMFLTGYAIDAETLQRVAEPADGPSAQAVAVLARETGVAIVWGFAERDLQGAVFNATQAVDARGQRLGVYRKTHLFGELDRSRFTASDGAPTVVELCGWTVGLLICYDVEFPEAVRALALRGVDLVVVPTANMVGFEVVPLLLVPARAYENQLFVAYANCSGREAGLVYGGLSVLAGPDGRLVSQADDSSTLLTIDLAPDLSARTSHLADRRPDTYAALTAPLRRG
jgi:predicted amidohydrolase